MLFINSKINKALSSLRYLRASTNQLTGVDMDSNILNQKLLLELFEYKDGHLYWKKNANSSVKTGDKAGSIRNDGYWRIGINGKAHTAHRTIFLYHHGFLPQNIDHINGIKTDNRIENLRAATNSQNQCNAKINTKNKSGIKGVCWNKKAKKWVVYLYINGKYKDFGKYFDINVAKFVADTMRHKYHGEFANNGYKS